MINPLPPEERRALAEVDEALSVPPTQEQAVDMGRAIDRLKATGDRLLASLSPREREVLAERLRRSAR